MTQRLSTNPVYKRAAETIRISVDMTAYGLDVTELLTGTPTVTEASLTLASKAVNSATFRNEYGGTCAIGKGVQFTAAGGTAGTSYSVIVSCGTNGTPAQTLEVLVPVYVRDA